MRTITLGRALYHHCQDTPTNCGRACSQMIISSLVQSPFTGSGITAPASATPIIVTQDTLKNREPDSADVVRSGERHWYTHPDELLILMRDAPEYTVPGDWSWRIANREN